MAVCAPVGAAGAVVAAEKVRDSSAWAVEETLVGV